ncbi:MAG TPA: rRNA adenine N(6)-methyltransferase family protein, partial [Myxococcota bacterium]|nr:rRNA adenine N(6)-methyltransferase family protein [Myxococcota bacterium]
MVNEHINACLASEAATFGRVPILEIGAGTGALTAHLLKHFDIVHAVERDRDLVPILNEHFLSFIQSKRLIIHEADGARFNIAQVFLEQPLILVGNLPYHLTSSILILALKNRALLKGAVFLVQKEVAERLCAMPKSKDYGFLTAIL